MMISLWIWFPYFDRMKNRYWKYSQYSHRPRCFSFAVTGKPLLQTPSLFFISFLCEKSFPPIWKYCFITNCSTIIPPFCFLNIFWIFCHSIFSCFLSTFLLLTGYSSRFLECSLILPTSDFFKKIVPWNWKLILCSSESRGS